MLLPKGIDMSDKLIGFENDKAQFLETRKYQRTVIAGAFGVPPYLVGDLERQTFNNAEQQGTNKVTEVLLPMARIFESAMERDLLTADDRAGGIIIRFNLDGLLRGDFLQRQQGLQIQRNGGVISANEWREAEGMNPITDAKDGGDNYYQQGPSGQTGTVPPPKPNANS
jgi:HK97 family phage portal protein